MFLVEKSPADATASNFDVALIIKVSDLSINSILVICQQNIAKSRHLTEFLKFT